MKYILRLAAAVLLLCVVTVDVAEASAACLLFPLSCLVPSKKYGEEQEALVMDIRSFKTTNYNNLHDMLAQTQGSAVLEDTRNWYVLFKIGHTIYQAERNDTIVQMAFGYKPKREEWIGKTVKMRFVDTKWLGIPGVEMRFKTPEGKDWGLAVVSIVGPDGKDECNALRWCPPQGNVNRAAREAEQLAAIQAKGGKSATDVQPAPVVVPQGGSADAGVAAAPPATAPTGTAVLQSTAAVSGEVAKDTTAAVAAQGQVESQSAAAAAQGPVESQPAAAAAQAPAESGTTAAAGAMPTAAATGH